MSCVCFSGISNCICASGKGCFGCLANLGNDSLKCAECNNFYCYNCVDDTFSSCFVCYRKLCERCCIDACVRCFKASGNPAYLDIIIDVNPVYKNSKSPKPKILKHHKANGNHYYHLKSKVIRVHRPIIFSVILDEVKNSKTSKSK